MSITGPITTVLKYFLNRKAEQQERIAAYLDSIAADANELAAIWREILIKYNEGSQDPLKDNEVRNALRNVSSLTGRQSYYFYRLMAFYENLSRVMGEKGAGYHEDIVFTLGSLLEGRNLAREKVESALAQAKQHYFLDEKNLSLS